MYLHRLIIVMLTLLCRSGSSAEEDVHAWRWQRTVTLARPAVEQCVVLDADLYARAAPGLHDLRLLQEGREVPYALEESFDEPNLNSPTTDRALYTTVLQIPLQEFHSLPPGPGERNIAGYRGDAILAAHVPVERIQLVPAANESSASHRAPVSLSLIAAPLTQGAELRGATRDSERIDNMLSGEAPVEMTAIGANLQNVARVSVAVFSVHFAAVLLQMRQRMLCFQPLSAAPLTMIFGNEKARPVRYEYSAHYQPLASPVLGRLGAAEANPTYHDPEVRRPSWASEHHVLLTCAVVLAIAAITGLPLLLSRS